MLSYCVKVFYIYNNWKYNIVSKFQYGFVSNDRTELKGMTEFALLYGSCYIK